MTEQFYFDMEFCDYNLNQHIGAHKKGKWLKMAEIWGIMANIAGGVAFIHAQQEVHRDLKPSNSITQIEAPT